ncbi:beta-glucanosyltransferase [Myotisia sp. PD_48]|nr:beta-glucanosyltransferase [Myotisia sp. PD_48]
MKTTASFVTALALGASSVLAGAGSALESRANVVAVEVKGNAFFKGNERFYIRGLDYQPGGSAKKEDPIADVDTCKRDIPLFEELGVNTIRVYHVDNSKNHDECMKLLADAGIYLVLDVNTPEYSINRRDPETSYNHVYLQSVFATVEMFAQYDNTLAFFSGNEVINDGETSVVAPWVKAVTRDIRQYLRERKLRHVPVGYSAADIDTNRLETAQYMNCGADDERSDFFAFNDYSWCSPSTFEVSGWDQKVKNFTDYGIPIFLSEYGCNTNKRDWGEVKALYSTKMTGVYSGGLVYEFSQEPNNYGLVELGDGEPKKLPDFNRLKEAFKNTKNPSGDGGYNSSGGKTECPKKNEPNWDVEGDALPAIPAPAKKFMKDGAGEGPGFKGGSQNSGTRSSGTATSSPTRTGSATSSSAAMATRPAELGFAPLIGVAIVVISTIFGASLIMI